MPRPYPAVRRATAWRTFDARDLRTLDRQMRLGAAPVCPCCQGALEARPETRLERGLPLDAVGYDLECRACRRFRCVVLHTERSLRLVRMRKLAAAVGAAGERRARRMAAVAA
jgi:hypothetical protein